VRKVFAATAVLALAAMGFLSASATMPDDTAVHSDDKAPNAVDSAGSPNAHKPLPDIGTKMPDGRIYAGLSQDTGKPSYLAAAGGRMPDGTVYAGISPDTNKSLYTTPEDAPGLYTWSRGIEYCETLSIFGHHDWRMPSVGELAVQFINRTDIGGFNETGRIKGGTGYYWSSLQVGDEAAWAQSFKDGFHENPSKDSDSSVRCVR
jgi:Protein of unknown function (DUF1566)